MPQLTPLVTPGDGVYEFSKSSTKALDKLVKVLASPICANNAASEEVAWLCERSASLGWFTVPSLLLMYGQRLADHKPSLATILVAPQTLTVGSPYWIKLRFPTILWLEGKGSARIVLEFGAYMPDSKLYQYLFSAYVEHNEEVVPARELDRIKLALFEALDAKETRLASMDKIVHRTFAAARSDD